MSHLLVISDSDLSCVFLYIDTLTLCYCVYFCTLISCVAAAAEKIPATPPVFVHNAYCDVASDYHKKKNVLRLRSADGAESLLEAASESDMKEWISKVQYYAGIYQQICYCPLVLGLCDIYNKFMFHRRAVILQNIIY
jgi:hypothetical protein